MCLQETKLSDEAFAEAFDAPLAERGYAVAHHGEGRWNGVALLSRVGLDDVVRGLPDEPRFPTPDAPAEARAVTATCGGLRVTSVYVPNGRTPDDPHYAYKLEWLAALRASVTDPATAVVAGDMNIAPTDDDLWDPALFVDSTHVTPAERKALAELTGLGLHDVVRDRWPDRPRLHLLGLPRRALPPGPGHAHRPGARRAPTRPGGWRRCGSTARPARASGPSDHAPVIVDLDTAPDGDIGPVVPPPSTPAKLPHRLTVVSRTGAAAPRITDGPSGYCSGVTLVETRELTVARPAHRRGGRRASRSPRAERCDDAVRRGPAAAAGWARTPAAERGAALHAAAAAVRDAADELAALNERETGKPLDDARGGVEAGAGTLVAVRRARAGAPRSQPARRLGRHRPDGPRAARRRRRADPVERPGRRRRRACSAPRWSPATPSCTSRASAARDRPPVRRARSPRTCPTGVLEIVDGDGAVGAQLAAAPVDVVAHVGSTATGRAIARGVRPHRRQGRCWRTAATTR